jgi:addiction module HigA family antidote
MSHEVEKRRPTLPGEFIREDVLEEHNLTQDELARRLGVSRLTVNELVNDRRAITPEMALRLGKLTGQTPEYWLNLQRRLDLWEARRSLGRALNEIEPLPVVEDTDLIAQYEKKRSA